MGRTYVPRIDSENSSHVYWKVFNGRRFLVAKTQVEYFGFLVVNALQIDAWIYADLSFFPYF